jgi:hypothetical protein
MLLVLHTVSVRVRPIESGLEIFLDSFMLDFRLQLIFLSSLPVAFKKRRHKAHDSANLNRSQVYVCRKCRNVCPLLEFYF